MESAIRELSEELGIQADADDLNFAGTFPIQYEKEFHGKMFRDNEIAFVYVYDEDVDIDKLTIQKEELDSVEWFDLEEVYQACQPPRDEKFCVPMGGLEIVCKYVSNQENVAKHISEMEEILDEANEILDTLDKNLNRLNDIQAKIQKLENYYTSKQWIDDFTADEQGLLPQDLKRGVLSEDGISSMLERNKDYMERIIQR